MNTATSPFVRALAFCCCCALFAVVRAAEPPVAVTTTYKKDVTVERTTTPAADARPAKAKERYKVAALVANRTTVDGAKASAMQDLLTGYATDNGFAVIAHDALVDAAVKLAADGTNTQGRPAPAAALEAVLSDKASAARLAANLGADYVLTVTLTDFGTDKQPLADATLYKHQLRATYKLFDATTGAAATAGTTTATITQRAAAGAAPPERKSLVDDLIDATALDAAAVLSAAAHAGQAKVPPASVARDEATFEVHCLVADLVYPEVTKDERGQAVIGPGRYRLEPAKVEVELDGVRVGPAPGPFRAKPGLHKLRARREGFKDLESTVRIADGATLTLTMTLTAEAQAQFAELAGLTSDLKAGQAMTAAQSGSLGRYAAQLEKATISIRRQASPTADSAAHAAAPQPKAPAVAFGTVAATRSLTVATAKAKQGDRLDRLTESLNEHLEVELRTTRKFDVIDPRALAELLKTQALPAVPIDPPDPKAKPPKVAGLNYLLTASLTDFSDATAAVAIEGQGIVVRRRTVQATLSLKLYDTSTGLLLEAVDLPVERESKGAAAVNDPKDTMIEEVATELAAKAAGRLIDQVYPARVVAVADATVTINRGENADVAAGQVWEVFAKRGPVIDPDTGNDLGGEEVKVGEVEVTDVMAKFATARIVGAKHGIDAGAIVRRRPPRPARDR